MTASASDAPRRAAGLRTRSGNAMLRTRAAILDAAATCVERGGVRKTTMSEVAATGGVAKATLYNHFRTKDDVLAALVEARVAALRSECEGIAAGQPDPYPVPGVPARAGGLAAALQHVAAALASDRALRRVAAEEPALLVPLLAPGEGRGWAHACEAVAAVLNAAGAPAAPAAVDVVLRWLLSQLLWPASPDEAAALLERGLLERGLLERGLLESGLSPMAEGASPAPVQGRASDDAHPAGLGWPAEPARLRTR